MADEDSRSTRLRATLFRRLCPKTDDGPASSDERSYLRPSLSRYIIIIWHRELGLAAAEKAKSRGLAGWKLWFSGVRKRYGRYEGYEGKPERCGLPAVHLEVGKLPGSLFFSLSQFGRLITMGFEHYSPLTRCISRLVRDTKTVLLSPGTRAFPRSAPES